MKYIVFISIVVFLNVIQGSSVRTEEVYMDEIMKVGVFEYEPYFMVDADGNMSGYYYDYMRLLQEQYHFEYEFVIGTLEEGLKKLVDGKIDIMLGLSMNAGRDEELIYNHYRMNKEVLGIFSNHKIDLASLHSHTNLKLGMLTGDSNFAWVLNFLEANNIDVSVIYEEDYKTLVKLFEDNKIDLIVANIWKEKDYNLVYEFVGRDVYIAGNKGSQAVLNCLDQMIEKLDSKKENPLDKLYQQYFGREDASNQNVIITGIVYLMLVLCIFPMIKKKMIRNKIRARMNKNQYLLQYQPIYNPRNNRVVGFEGLLRMLDKDNKLISPFEFIPEIEKNDMLFEVSLWLIENVIEDYRKIKNYACMRETDFYLSINLSLKELENDVFTDRAISLLTQSNLGQQKICLEIIERFKMCDTDQIIQNIKRLKQAGFILAIDDFGVEYSNLDIFQKLDVDIIKVDKTFVDGIGKDYIKEEIVLFISKLAHIRNRSVVLEGVEEINQDTKIKEIEHDRLYVQGYYYNKPMNLEQIKRLFFKDPVMLV